MPDGLADRRFDVGLTGEFPPDVGGGTIECGPNFEIGIGFRAGFRLVEGTGLRQQIVLQETADGLGGRRFTIGTLFLGQGGITLLFRASFGRDGAIALHRGQAFRGDGAIALHRGDALRRGGAVPLLHRGAFRGARLDGLHGADHGARRQHHDTLAVPATRALCRRANFCN